MGKLLVIALTGALVGAVPAGGAALASPTVRMAIVHTVRGCHVWKTTKELGPTATIAVARGTKLELRMSCPMDFDVVQSAGPKLALGAGRLYAGTVLTIRFEKRGLYVLTAKNVQSSEQLGLQTLGPDNTLTLRVRVT